MLIIAIACTPSSAPSTVAPARTRASDVADDTGGDAIDDTASSTPDGDGDVSDTGGGVPAPERYVIECDDGSGASHYARFPARFAVGDIPRAGAWVEYAPAYIATMGGGPVAAYGAGVAIDGDGYALAYCGWFGAGWMVDRVTLVVE